MCTVSVDPNSLVGFTDENGQIVEVTVGGTVSACDDLAVSLRSDSQGVDLGTVPATLQPDGSWSASIAPEAGASLGVECGDKFTITAECVTPSDGVPCPAVVVLLELRCVPLGCPAVTIEAEVGECLPDGIRREVTFTVQVATGAEIQYVMAFGGSELPVTVTGTGSGTFTLSYPYVTGQTYFAALVMTSPAGCDTVTPPVVEIVVPVCGDCPSAPPVLTVRPVIGGMPVVHDERACLEPGNYEVGLLDQPPVGTTVRWYIDDVAAGVGAAVQVEIAAGQQVEVEAVFEKPGCPPPAPGDVTLTGCADCPSGPAVLVLETTGPDPQLIPTGEGCFAAGDYIVRLVDPQGPVEITWRVDDELVLGANGRTLPVSVAEGQTVEVDAVVQVPGTGGECEFRDDLTIDACACGPISLTVFDQDGQPVDPAECVVPGEYTARVSGEDVDDPASVRSWTVDGADIAGNGTEQGVRVPAPVTSSCGGGAAPPTTTVGVRVRTPGCRDRSAAVVLRPCAEFVFDICCQLLGTLILFVAGLTVIAAALALCPGVVVNPAAVAFFATFGFAVFLVLLALLAALVVLWFLRCPPDWCRDLLPKLWQLGFIAGIAFVYFGSCPICSVTPVGSLLIWGVVLLVVGAGLLAWWIVSCRPTRCQTVWRLIELGIVNSVLGVIEVVLGFAVPAALPACVSVLALIFLGAVNAFLDGLVLGLPAFCGFNPFQPRAAVRGRRRVSPNPALH